MVAQVDEVKLVKGAAVTIGIVVACKDGAVVGADRKVVRSRGTRIKSLEDKVFKLSFRDGRNLLACGSGGTDFVKRAIERIDPGEYGGDVNGPTYRDIVERRIAWLGQNLSERGLEYDAVLLFAMIDVDDRPFIGHVIPTGLTETSNTGYFTTGIAAPYAELVLKDTYSSEITVEDAKLIVAGLIEKIGTVDNDVEGSDLFFMSVVNKKVNELTWPERMGIGQESLSFNFKEDLDDLKKAIDLYRDMEKTFQEDAKKRKKEEG